MLEVKQVSCFYNISIQSSHLLKQILEEVASIESLEVSLLKVYSLILLQKVLKFLLRELKRIRC